MIIEKLEVLMQCLKVTLIVILQTKKKERKKQDDFFGKKSL